MLPQHERPEKVEDMHPQTFLSASGHGNLVRGGWEIFKGTGEAPPTSRPSPSASWPRCARGSPTPPSHRSLHCKAAAPRPQTGHMLSPSQPSKPSLEFRTLLHTLLPNTLGRAAQRSPALASDRPLTGPLVGPDSRLPFLLLVSCHCRCGPLRRSDAEHLGFLAGRELWPSSAPGGPGGW